MAGIQFKDVIKRYGRGKHELQVIHGITAQVGDGEFVVIVGPAVINIMKFFSKAS